jgi:vacuolar-type H+-ATPase subunit I/STV1
MVKRKSSSTSSNTKFQRTQLEAKPPIPSSNDRPIMGLKTTKNFIVSNATQAIIQEPKKLKDKEESFLEKDTYGKIPSYLHKVKQDIQREKELVEEYVKQQNHDEKVDGGSSSHEGTEYEIMDEDERQNLIRSLKKKWDEVNSRYQKICHRVTIDSLGDIKRKEMQEAELQQLEDDIQRLSRPGPLYILKQ